MQYIKVTYYFVYYKAVNSVLLGQLHTSKNVGKLKANTSGKLSSVEKVLVQLNEVGNYSTNHPEGVRLKKFYFGQSILKCLKNRFVNA